MSGSIVWDDAQPPQPPQPAAGIVWDDAPKPPHPVAGPSGSELTDWGRKLGTAGTVALGATLGLPRAAADAADWLAEGPSGQFRGAPISEAVRIAGYPIGRALRSVQPEGGFSQAMGGVKAPGTNDPLFPTMGQAIEGAYQTTGATEYKPATWAGRRTMDALTGAAMTAVNPSLLPAGIGAGVAGGQTVETAARYGLPPSEQNLLGMLAGYLGARTMQGAANNLTSAAGAPVPLDRPVSQTRAELAQVAQDKYGIPIRGAMVEGRNSPVRLVDTELNNVPFSGMRGSNEAIQTAGNRAVGRTFGANAPELSTDVFQAAKDRLVNRLNSITPRLGISQPAMNGLVNDLGSIETAFERLKGSANVAPVRNAIDDVLNVYQTNNGRIPGDVYHAMIKRGSHLDRMRGSADPDIRRAAGDIMSSLENAVENSLPPNSRALADFRDWKNQWRSMRIAEDAVDASGNVSFAKLNQTANRETDNYKFGGGGDIAELGRIGGALFPTPPQSNTAARSVVWKALSAPGAMLGAAGAGGMLRPDMLPELATAGAAAAAGAAIPAATGRMVGAYLRSPTYLNRVIATGMNPEGFRFENPALLQRALLAKALQDRANTENLPRP